MQGCIYQACKHLHVPLPTWWTSSGYSVIFTQARKISDYVDHEPRRPRPKQLRRAPTTSTTDHVDHVSSGSAELRPHRPPDHVAMMIAAKNGATTTATTVMTTGRKNSRIGQLHHRRPDLYPKISTLLIFIFNIIFHYDVSPQMSSS